MKKVFIKDKSDFLKRNKDYNNEIFTEELIKDLPEPLKKYLRVCGYMNMPVPINANVYWTESWLRLSPEKDWGKLETIQFNSVKPLGRVAYMRFLSMPVSARDIYKNGYGEIHGKLFNLIRIIYDNSKEVAQSALITVFCEFMFIPGYLLLNNVRWEQIDDYSVRGILEDNGIKVSGVFYFNEEGLFTHFESYDRYYSIGKNTYRKIKFSAIVESYKMQDNLKICEKVKIVWHLPEGEYEYYKGTVDKIEFNNFMLLTLNDSFVQKNIDDNKSDKIIFPFSIKIDPMEKLLLINFEKDPDSIYVGFEPQVFRDTAHGVGHLIIGWRKDKKIDVYHQKSLKLDSSKYSIAGAGLNKMIPVDFEIAFYDVNELGVQAHYKFRDILGRNVEILISEKNQKKRKPFGLLAPMGDAATKPTSMPIVLLHDFYFVRKNDTDIKVSINNKSHKLDDLPIPMDWQKMTFTRYSPKPLIATLNPEYTGVLDGFKPLARQEIFQEGDYVYEIEWTAQIASIKSMSIQNNIHLLTMSFSPSFPCLNTISANTKYKGEFTISGNESVGSISGEYTIQSTKESIQIRIVPSKGWKPKITKFSTWFLFTVAKVFKKWATTYQWDAELYKSPEGLWYMQSKWTRTGKILKD